ncbi:hypothetical protein [Paludibacterium purpuratum]|uniref:Uncharacterized protein n=1 Tax=Paludibacterium purpuratum TaxID=1144873 RepID=A0A4R7B1P7_9NEIS|nr:hypothetical protein [Paludibacterium purpuratum]TDR76641.1 hypothetical protein DFP86_11067 [Paludibacterium purpuratum]
MSSPAAPPSQDWLRITQANQTELAERIKEVHALQREIESLTQRAQTDPKARTALQQLEKLATSDWEPMRQRMEKTMSRLRQQARPPTEEQPPTSCATPVASQAAIRRTYL